MDMYFYNFISEISQCLEVVASTGAAVHNESPLTTLTPGEVVMVYCSEFKEWDRGIVLQVTEDRVSIKSADYGSIFTESIQNIRALPEEAAKLPLRAVQICLEGESTKLLYLCPLFIFI